jgi:acylphosphatase
MQKRIECTVVGRVQMVMYRDFTVRNARAFELTGRVKNRDDGAVVVVAEGEESSLTLLVEKLTKGSILAHVERVDVVWKDATGEFTDFRIDYT